MEPIDNGSPKTDHKKKKSMLNLKLFTHSNSSPNLKLLDKNGELIPTQHEKSSGKHQKISSVTPSPSTDSLLSPLSSNNSSLSQPTSPLSLKLSTGSSPSLSSSSGSVSNTLSPSLSSNNLSLEFNSSTSLENTSSSNLNNLKDPNSPQISHKSKKSRWIFVLKKVKSSTKLKKEIEEVSNKTGLIQQYTSLSNVAGATTANDKKKSQRKSRFINTSLAFLEDYTTVPKIIKLSIEFLFEKSLLIPGLFRESANALELQKLSQLLEPSHENDQISLADYKDSHCLAGLIKLYFREKPNPVFPYDLHKSIHNVLQEPDRIAKTKQLLESGLNGGQFYIIRYLFELLNSIHNNQEVNKMNSYNLAVCFAPTLIHSFDVSCIDVIGSIIEDYEAIFAVEEPIAITEPNNNNENTNNDSTPTIEVTNNEQDVVLDKSTKSKRTSSIVVHVNRNSIQQSSRILIKTRPISLNEHRKSTMKSIKRLSSVSNSKNNVEIKNIYNDLKASKNTNNNNNIKSETIENNNNNNNNNYNNVRKPTVELIKNNDSIKNSTDSLAEDEEEEFKIIPSRSRPNSIHYKSLSTSSTTTNEQGNEHDNEPTTEGSQNDPPSLNSSNNSIKSHTSTTSTSTNGGNELSSSFTSTYSNNSNNSHIENSEIKPNVKSIISNVNADNAANSNVYTYKFIPTTPKSTNTPTKKFTNKPVPFRKYSSSTKLNNYGSSNSVSYTPTKDYSSKPLKSSTNSTTSTPVTSSISTPTSPVSKVDTSSNTNDGPSASSLISNFQTIISTNNTGTNNTGTPNNRASLDWNRGVVNRKLDSVKKNITKYEQNK